ncbi:TPA: phage gp6-like head-tail connector protein [Escherichia coli]|nr:phage gp6-like head-tail connector protein [Escherichia coli]HEL8044839.1 phage gp6-like head-tail connector protein [Escherichia coli]HEL8049437.1 phage gp6-like head-tail connector protein [Escherichia coli]HEL8054324.1 phage gp6-like head-tail connector protein [Escherichia coli]HEL8059182.1 phage gp6-like head-tail connector protein [Escherichia coli]
MTELVTLDMARMHLRMDDDYGDEDLLLKIQGASATLLSWLQEGRSRVVDDDGSLIDGEPLKRVQTALLILLGWLERNRGGEEGDKLSPGELPYSVTMLINDLRKPVIV